MSGHDLLDLLVPIVQLLVVPALGLGLRLMHELHHEIRSLNGRLVSLEQWRTDHLQESERRMQDLLRYVSEMRSRQA